MIYQTQNKKSYHTEDADIKVFKKFVHDKREDQISNAFKEVLEKLKKDANVLFSFYGDLTMFEECDFFTNSIKKKPNEGIDYIGNRVLILKANDTHTECFIQVFNDESETVYQKTIDQKVLSQIIMKRNALIWTDGNVNDGKIDWWSFRIKNGNKVQIGSVLNTLGTKMGDDSFFNKIEKELVTTNN